MLSNKKAYLKLHLTGGAIAFLEFQKTHRHTFDKAIQVFKNQYLSKNRVELLQLKFKERKFYLSRDP